MPLLKIIRTRRLVALCSLEESTAIQIDQYAAYAKASADEVVNKALEYTFSMDKEFQKFIATDPKVPASLRIRRKASTSIGSKRGPKPAGFVAAD